ncbi:MAG: hypothetical protein L3J07_04595 [Candidatus Magasanikbacteria bacterium]|nr:hypothetical protein [Candidatus Magasanikbacteria bacterium]
MSRYKGIKIYEIFITTPKHITDINKKVWPHVRGLFKNVGVMVSVLSSSKKYKVPKDRNLFWAKLSLTEVQLEQVRAIKDVLHIFCKDKMLK